MNFKVSVPVTFWQYCVSELRLEQRVTVRHGIVIKSVTNSLVSTLYCQCKFGYPRQCYC